MSEEKLIQSFAQENIKEGIRVFVAGGSRDGNNPIWTEEAYKLGKQIIKMDFKLDFGLSNRGIMGAVAQGVLDGWEKKKIKENSPVSAITTQEYLKYYENDDILEKMAEIIVAKTLEERKQKLLAADFVVFAPGGVGTLDELAYDCVAMQDGLLPVKPFIMYNINGFFHHLLEYLKDISLTEFADPVPFIVVDDSNELSIVFRLLKLRHNQFQSKEKTYASARQLIYELPYFIKKKVDSTVLVEDIIAHLQNTSLQGTAEERIALANEVEQAYLEKEIERMYDRLAHTGQDTATISEKLKKLKSRKIGK